MKWVFVILYCSVLVCATDIEMIKIPSGFFTMGCDSYQPSYPSREVYLDEYYISKTEITNEQFLEFSLSSGIYPVHWSGRGSDKYFFRIIPFPGNLAKLPVVNISFNTALLFCKWLSEKTGRFYCLPTEAQWEKAARGTDGRFYPWGNSQSKIQEKAVFRREWFGSRTYAEADSFRESASPYGCLHMSGNVSEWTIEPYSNDFFRRAILKNPVNIFDTSENKVIRGGNFASVHFWQISTYGRMYAAQNGPENEQTGFRVVSVEKESPLYSTLLYMFNREIRKITPKK